MPALSSTVFRRLARAFLVWVLLPVGALVFVGALTLYLLCAFKSDVVAAALEERLRTATDLPWRIEGPVRLLFSPFPGIAVEKASLPTLGLKQAGEALAREGHGPEPDTLFSVRALRLHPDFQALFTGSLRFRLVELDAPAVILTGDSPGTALALSVAEPGDSSAHIIAVLAECVRSDAMKTLPALRLSNGTLHRYSPDGTLSLALRDLRADLEPANTARPLELSATFALPPADLELAFTLNLGPGEGDTLLDGSLSGRVSMTPPPRKRSVHGEFSSSLVWKDRGATLLLPDFRIQSEGDALSAALSVDTLRRTGAGKVRIERLSLPRWFRFGRGLPPGLQQALHSLSGSFDFKGSLTGAGAYNLEGTAGDLGVSGYVGAPDFSAPVVEVFLKVGDANLDMIFPFLSPPGALFPDPEPLNFDFPPLAPYPEEPENDAVTSGGPEPARTNDAVRLTSSSPAAAADSGIDVGYDVRITVARPIVHQVAGGEAEVLIFPHKNATRVAFSGKNLLKGTASGYIDIFDDVVKMHYTADKMRLDLLPENQGGAVRIGGVVTGVGDIDIRVGADSSWADLWKLNLDAAIADCSLSGGEGGKDWRLSAEKARIAGKSDIFTVVSKGMYIDGLWDLAVQGVSTSWNPKGKDAISGTFQGALTWPPVKEGPPVMRNGKALRQRRGLRELSGKLAAAGSLIVPLGSKRVPVKGKLATGLNWQVYDETVTFDQASLAGLGSVLTGKVSVDAHGPTVTLTAPVNFKIAPRTLMKEWKLLPGAGVLLPELVTGTAKVTADRDVLSFGSLDLQLDGAPIKGGITGYFSPKGFKNLADPPKPDPGESVNHWTFTLQAEHLDIDKYLPPAEASPASAAASPAPSSAKGALSGTRKRPAKNPPASTKKWDLSFFEGLSADMNLLVKKAKVRNLHPQDTRITGTLRGGRFSLRGGTADLYGGVSTIIAQGAVVPGMSLVTVQRGLMELKGVDLGKALYDRNKSTAYGGALDLNMDIQGNLSCDADLPAALSGNWQLHIADGLYPAFVGDALRNTFDRASAGGVMEKGVLRWNNFRLSGFMVDMRGEGWIDLVKKVMDFGVSVTLAKVPAVPVRFSGSFDAPTMELRGMRMVLDTAQNAGSTVFGLVTGVLELPLRALRGVGDILSPDKKTAPQPVGRSSQKRPER